MSEKTINKKIDALYKLAKGTNGEVFRIYRDAIIRLEGLKGQKSI